MKERFSSVSIRAKIFIHVLEIILPSNPLLVNYSSLGGLAMVTGQLA